MNSIDIRKASEGGVKSPVSLFDAIDMLFMSDLLPASQICVPVREKHSDVAMAIPCAFFTNTHQKFDWRRTYEINES